jgi:hypothetical protein
LSCYSLSFLLPSLLSLFLFSFCPQLSALLRYFFTSLYKNSYFHIPEFSHTTYNNNNKKTFPHQSHLHNTPKPTT